MSDGHSPLRTTGAEGNIPRDRRKERADSFPVMRFFLFFRPDLVQFRRDGTDALRMRAGLGRIMHGRHAQARTGVEKKQRPAVRAQFQAVGVASVKGRLRSGRGDAAANPRKRVSIPRSRQRH